MGGLSRFHVQADEGSKFKLIKGFKVKLIKGFILKLMRGFQALS
jgi:hypothetical protein